MIRIPNFDSYNWELKDNVLVLIPKIPVIEPEELLEKDLSFCKIEECRINDVDMPFKKIKTYSELYLGRYGYSTNL